MGDFNEVLNNEESVGPMRGGRGQTRYFKEMLGKLGLAN